LIGGTSDADNGAFVMDNAMLKSRVVFDFETKSTYSIRVRATDEAGATYEKSILISVSDVDDSVPSQPTNLNVSKLTTTGFSLNWSVAVDNVGVTSYEIYRDAAKLAVVPATTLSYDVSGLKAGTTYRFQVRAKDAAGNFSAMSQTIEIKWKDSTPPTVPNNVGFSAITGSGFTVSWSASTDNVAVTNYEVYRNGKLVSNTKNRTFTVTGLNDNAKQIVTVRAIDAAGNKSTLSTPVVTKNTLSVVGTRLYHNFKLVTLGVGIVPTQVSGQMMVPHKPILEELGFKLSVNNTSRAITATKTGMTIRFTPNSKTAVVNGQNKMMPLAPTLVKGIVMIPLRFIAGEVGYQVMVSK
jgi:hypothetical protein